jgi:hypothetical protein
MFLPVVHFGHSRISQPCFCGKEAQCHRQHSAAKILHQMEIVGDVQRHIIHYSFHLLVPFVLGKLFWKENWWKAGIIMVGTMATLPVIVSFLKRSSAAEKC